MDPYNAEIPEENANQGLSRGPGLEHHRSPWSIIGHNKAESERDTPEKVFELLSSRFGAGGNRMQVRQAFQSRIQHEKEDWMQYLDALEGLRSQGFPQETITTKRYEILQRFMEGVRDPALRRELAIVYASEVFLTEPPTVESLRFTTRQLQRNRLKPNQFPQPYDPRLAMRSRPHPFAPLPPNKMVLPQGVMLRPIKQQRSLRHACPLAGALIAVKLGILPGTVPPATRLANQWQLPSQKA